MTATRGSGGRAQPEPEFLEVARVLRPWGVTGEVKVKILSSHPEDIAPGRQVYVGEDRRACEIQGARAQGDYLIVKLAGYSTPEQAEALRGLHLYIDRGSASPLRPREYYRHQIIGLAVVTLDGADLGKVEEILETGAHDVYVVHGPRGEVLLPARVEVIRDIDLASGVMRVSLLPGLLPE
ncbi:MAG TPA: ribosome maturation factor RimM [Anaerolineae bacterium]|nr:ribosome maturation factor RimM [Anaerolineae bacterium]